MCLSACLPACLPACEAYGAGGGADARALLMPVRLLLLLLLLLSSRLLQIEVDFKAECHSGELVESLAGRTGAARVSGEAAPAAAGRGRKEQEALLLRGFSAVQKLTALLAHTFCAAAYICVSADLLPCPPTPALPSPPCSHARAAEQQRRRP